MARTSVQRELARDYRVWASVVVHDPTDHSELRPDRPKATQICPFAACQIYYPSSESKPAQRVCFGWSGELDVYFMVNVNAKSD